MMCWDCSSVAWINYLEMLGSSSRDEFQYLHRLGDSFVVFFLFVCGLHSQKTHNTVTFFSSLSICCCETSDLIATPRWFGFNTYHRRSHLHTLIMVFLQDMQSREKGFVFFPVPRKIIRTFNSLSFMECYVDTFACICAA